MLGRAVGSAGENGEEQSNSKRDSEGWDQDLAGRRRGGRGRQGRGGVLKLRHWQGYLSLLSCLASLQMTQVAHEGLSCLSELGLPSTHPRALEEVSPPLLPEEEASLFP